MSRPDRASFRLEGDIKVVGRTPMTFARGLNGPYRITGFEVGYNSWSRRIVLDGVSADTIWMSLSRKHGISAGVRSLIIPGLGQFYDENKGRAGPSSCPGSGPASPWDSPRSSTWTGRTSWRR
jgi:hypothetical protein